MTTRIRTLMLTLTMFAATDATLRGQIVADGATNILSNVTNSFPGNLIIGTNAPFTLLVLSDNALVGVGGNGIIGQNSTSKSNEVRLISPTAYLFISTNLYIGSNGSFNRLVVSNGATVRDFNGQLGLMASASNNLAVVTGAGSVWSNAGFTLGVNGAGGQLIVSNGGVLRNNIASVGANNTSSNNLAIVTGPGSLWSTAFGFTLGFLGAGNQVVVSNGGFVRSEVASMGSQPSGSNNLVVITGSGSTWSNASDLYVGNSSAGNQLLVSEGGAMRNGHGYVGANATASNNRVLITGAGSVWSNALDLEIGAFSANNRMIVSNGGTVFAKANGLIGATANQNTNSVTVTDPGTRWLVGTNLYVGSNGALNRLTIANGGLVANELGVIGGQNISSSNNLAIVTGSGSVWSNRQVVIIGYSGNGNRLEVSDGALLTTPSYADIGVNVGANSNSALLTGAGSQWLLGDGVLVGDFGSGNRLVVSNGAAIVTASPSYVGFASSNNEAVVTGPGTSWTSGSGQSFFVGYFGRNNRLLVSDGGLLSSSSGTIGDGSNSSNNLAVVTGLGSVWTNLDDLHVGFIGRGNQLIVTNGALVVNSNGIIGFSAPSSNNLATVTGNGSIWSNAASLFVGSNGMANRLVVSNGGFVAAADATVGSGLNSANNEVLITGPGSLYSNAVSINLNLGLDGSSNRMQIENGGRLAANPILGRNISSSGNALTVTGPGSEVLVLNEDIELIVGADGSRNLMVVSNGAAVSAHGGVIGYDVTGSNNLAVVTGAGSVWSHRITLQVGYFGPNNRLLISDGGTVSSSAAVNVGFRTTTSSNNLLHVANGTLRVTNLVGTGTLEVRSGTNRLDAGLIEVDFLRMTNALGFFEFNGGTLITRGAAISNGEPFVVGGPGGVPGTWEVRAGAGNHLVSGDVIVGELASFNRLLVGNGALLTNSEGFVGLGSKSNVAVVAGPGSRWVLGSNLEVGSSGSFNSLVISNGGLVADTDAVIGEGSSSSNNLALVTGAGSVWSNQVSMRIGFFGLNSRLMITDGGAVFASNAITVGFSSAASSNNLIQINDGTLRVQNLAGTGALDIRSGTNRLDAGLVDVDRLTITNARGFFEFNGGTLRTAGTTIGTGQIFNVGNGASTATLELRGGTHVFLGGLAVANHATLTGNGSIPGALTVQAGGTLAPGASIGKIIFNNSPSLQGTVVMEITKNGATLTNDQIQVTAPLSYGGTLTVSNLGPTALAAGDRFQLFNATSFAGMFSGLSLPKPGNGLNWTNKLLVDGSIEVVTWAGPKIGNVTRSGTNLIFSVTDGFPGGAYNVLTASNIVTPLTNWVILNSGTFDWLGNTTVTNGINRAESQRFFRFRIP